MPAIFKPTIFHLLYLIKETMSEVTDCKIVSKVHQENASAESHNASCDEKEALDAWKKAYRVCKDTENAKKKVSSTYLDAEKAKEDASSAYQDAEKAYQDAKNTWYDAEDTKDETSSAYQGAKKAWEDAYRVRMDACHAWQDAEDAYAKATAAWYDAAEACIDAGFACGDARYACGDAINKIPSISALKIACHNAFQESRSASRNREPTENDKYVVYMAVNKQYQEACEAYLDKEEN